MKIPKKILGYSSAFALSMSLLASVAVPTYAKTTDPTESPESTTKLQKKTERTEYMLQVAEGTNVYEIVASVNGTVLYELSTGGAYLIELSSDREKELKETEGVIKLDKFFK